MSYCVKCIVKGQVQGVFYRASTQDVARSLHLKGHAYNLANGDVEVIACGKQDSIEKLEKWLWNGPAQAVVQNVTCEVIEGDIEGGFVTG